MNGNDNNGMRQLLLERKQLQQCLRIVLNNKVNE